jgi:aspartyl-tRNA(Asn)/glutamyl-tRNA(Gln) amidotransferase subunit C
MITKKDVKHIAKLARLKISEREVEKFQKEFSKILEYFALLKEVNVEKVKPTSHSIEIENVMREDEPSKKRKMENEKLLKMMPEKENGYLKVKSVF